MAHHVEHHRLQLSASEHELLESILHMTRMLYNAALEDRRNAWEHGKRLASKQGLGSPFLLDADLWTPPSRFGQFAMLSEIRNDYVENWGGLPSNIGREVLDRLDKAFQGSFSRLKAGATPGFPRFKSASRWRSFGWDEMNGVSIEGNKVVFSAFGLRRHIAFKRHRAWPGGAEPRSVRFVRKCNRWEVHVQVWFAVEGELVQIRPVMPHESSLHGLDDAQIKTLRKERRQIAAGINAVLSAEHEARRKAAFIAALDDGSARGWDANVENHATNDLGSRIENPRLTTKHRDRRSRVEKAIARQVVGSKRWRQSVRRRKRLGEREANANRTFAHQVSVEMVHGRKVHGQIVRAGSPFLAFEALKLANMTASASGTIEEPGTNVAQKSGLNREMLGSCHGMRMQYATYKAERAGGMVVRVPPHGTSQTCSGCGARGLIDAKRLFRCGPCGLVMYRDRNAAINIRNRSREVVCPGVERPSRREARKDQREALAA